MNLFLNILLVVLISFSGFVYPQGSWKKITSPTEKVLRKIFFVDEQSGWACGLDGVIIRTTNGGNNWEVLNSGTTSPVVDIFFIDENNGWALSLRQEAPFGTTIHKTTDGGISWQLINYPFANKFMNAIFFKDEFTGWLGGSGLAKTTDGGLTWVSSAVDSGIGSTLPVYEINLVNDTLGFACGGFVDVAGVIWKTTDAGTSWSSTPVSPDQVFDLHIFNEDKLLTLSGDPEGFYGIGLITSSNGGNDWNFNELSIFGLSYAIDFRTPDEGWSASGFKFLFSSDGGTSWSERETPDSTIIYDLQFVNESTGFACGQQGALLKYSAPEPEYYPPFIELGNNYPNPFNFKTTIIFNLLTTKEREPLPVSIKLFDILGNEIAELYNRETLSGHYEFELNVFGLKKPLSSGVYILRATAGDVVSYKKIIITK